MPHSSSQTLRDNFPGRIEFIALMAVLAALDAFSIDAMLPALSDIDRDLNIPLENQRQYVVTSLFLGFSFGVIIYGFVADQVGRRLPIGIGYLIYILGTCTCILADSFPTLLSGRVLQGLGAAGPYVLSVAIVRDRFVAREMSEVLSLIMMVFIGVPIVAPFVGQGIMLAAGWRSIFIALGLFAILSLIWFWHRQPESLKPEHRVPVSGATIINAIREVLVNRQTRHYLIGLSAVTGAFIAYLSTGQQIFQDMYDLGTLFPLVFASLASAFGVSSFLNSRWVKALGIPRLVHRALITLVLASVLFIAFSSVYTGLPPLWLYLGYLAIMVFSYGMLFGNMTTLALEPMGHIAGAASSVITCFSTLVAITLSTIIGAQLEDNVVPLVIGFAVLGAIACGFNYPHLPKKSN